jgi:hypothetical protein
LSVLRSLTLALLVAACSSGAKDRPVENKPTPPADGIDNRPAKAAPGDTGPPIVSSKADMEGVEGKQVRLRGTFRFPTEKAFARNKLELDDGTIVILSRPADAAVAAVLVEANQGARMTVRGVIYAGMIPDRYKIISHTPDPYLVDVDGAELTP